MDQLLVGRGDGSGPPPEIVESERVDHASLEYERTIPVHLVDEREPGETKDWNPLLAQVAHIEELLPQPARGFVGTATNVVRLGVHHRTAVALKILAGDDRPTEHLPRWPNLPARCDKLFIALVEVVAHDNPVAQVVLHEPGEFLARQTIVQQVKENVAGRWHGIEEI